MRRTATQHSAVHPEEGRWLDTARLVTGDGSTYICASSSSYVTVASIDWVINAIQSTSAIGSSNKVMVKLAEFYYYLNKSFLSFLFYGNHSIVSILYNTFC